jgi:hypothetical protein
VAQDMKLFWNSAGTKKRRYWMRIETLRIIIVIPYMIADALTY